MAAADYRLMTEATGQRIAAALEALSGFGDYLTTADVVNNLNSTATTAPLAAAQGKVLNDQIGSINTAIGNQADFAMESDSNGIGLTWVDTSNNRLRMYIGKLDASNNYVQFWINTVDKGYIVFTVSRNA